MHQDDSTRHDTRERQTLVGKISSGHLDMLKNDDGSLSELHTKVKKSGVDVSDPKLLNAWNNLQSSRTVLSDRSDGSSGGGGGGDGDVQITLAAIEALGVRIRELDLKEQAGGGGSCGGSGLKATLMVEMQGLRAALKASMTAAITTTTTASTAAASKKLNWVTAAHSAGTSKPPRICLDAYGMDGFGGFAGRCTSDKIIFAGIRIGDDIFFVYFVGSNVGGMAKGKASLHRGAVEKVMDNTRAGYEVVDGELTQAALTSFLDHHHHRGVQNEFFNSTNPGANSAQATSVIIPVLCTQQIQANRMPRRESGRQLVSEEAVTTETTPKEQQKTTASASDICGSCGNDRTFHTGRFKDPNTPALRHMFVGSPAAPTAPTTTATETPATRIKLGKGEHKTQPAGVTEILLQDEGETKESATQPSATTTTTTAAVAAVDVKEVSKVAVVETDSPTTSEKPGVTLYTLEELQAGVPPGVDKTKKEEHLSVAHFVAQFGMSREDFAKLPKWKRNAAKKKVGLF